MGILDHKAGISETGAKKRYLFFDTDLDGLLWKHSGGVSANHNLHIRQLHLLLYFMYPFLMCLRDGFKHLAQRQFCGICSTDAAFKIQVLGQKQIDTIRLIGLLFDLASTGAPVFSPIRVGPIPALRIGYSIPSILQSFVLNTRLPMVIS
jgi:hypothetical protein